MLKLPLHSFQPSSKCGKLSTSQSFSVKQTTLIDKFLKHLVIFLALKTNPCISVLKVNTSFDVKGFKPATSGSVFYPKLEKGRKQEALWKLYCLIAQQTQ